MINRISAVVLTTLLSSCSNTPTERYTNVAKYIVPRAVHIEVQGLDEQLVLRFDGKHITIEKEIVSVTYLGSGVFISNNNHVLTCAHLFGMKKVERVVVTDYYGNQVQADVLYKQEDRDLALLLTNFDLPTPSVQVADPRTLEVGQEVLAVGSPLGLAFTLTHGIISRLYTDEVGYNLTQSDTAINPGNSGGPLFNLQGELVGINVAMIPPVNAPIFTGLGFSVQCGQILEFLTKFKGLGERRANERY